MKKLKVIVICLLLTIICGCNTTIKSNYVETKEVTNYVKIITNKNKEIVIELYPEVAPISVENFQNLVNEKFYDGIIFHRVIKDFVVQGGAYDESLQYKEAKTIKGEFSENGVENTLLHTKGVVSMARAQDFDSASSQFFICLTDQPSLDNKYAAFGKVVEGFENVLAIGNVETSNEVPTVNQVIKTMKFVKPGE